MPDREARRQAVLLVRKYSKKEALKPSDKVPLPCLLQVSCSPCAGTGYALRGRQDLDVACSRQSSDVPGGSISSLLEALRKLGPPRRFAALRCALRAQKLVAAGDVKGKSRSERFRVERAVAEASRQAGEPEVGMGPCC